MEADDILTDQMKICRPVFLELLCTFTVTIVADTGNIVGQCIQPYINHMARIKVYRNSPFEGSSGYTEILKSRKQEVVHHLILAGFRLDKFRMCIDMLDQAVCIFAHFEEISFFLCRNARTSAVRTFAVDKLGFCKERLTWSTVHSFVMSFIDISFCVHFFENLLYLFFMICICCTDKFVIRCIHQIPDTFNFAGYIVHKFLRSDACFCSLQLNFLSMFICSGLKKYIIALLSLIAGDCVCQHDLIRISDVRFA